MAERRVEPWSPITIATGRPAASISLWFVKEEEERLRR